MKNKTLIIITGLSCTGKTTLGEKLSQKYRIPFISKDTIKEQLFDSLGWKDREYSKKIGKVSYDIFYNFLDKLMSSGISFIAESNFVPEYDSKTLQNLKNKYGYDTVQILCHCDGKILFERFKQRAESGERHAGHQDHLNYDEFRNNLLIGKCAPLSLDGKLIECETTELEKTPYEEIVSQLNNLSKQN